MPTFNPAEPATDSDLVSAPVRDNFNALKEIIDAQEAVIATQAAAIADLQSRVAALEASPPSGVTLAQVQAEVTTGMATRAAKPTSSPLGYGASDPPTQGEVQGGFDLLANLITEMNA